MISPLPPYLQVWLFYGEVREIKNLKGRARYPQRAAVATSTPILFPGPLGTADPTSGTLERVFFTSLYQ